MTTPNFEVRGYVRLRLPTVFRRGPGPVGFFQNVAQASAPVKVMLTPQNRATYFSATGTITDQTQASLPTASGAAVNSLPPDQPLFFLPRNLTALLDTSLAERLADSFGPEGLMQATTTMLSALSAEGSDLAGLNKALADSGIGLAMERRKIKT